MKNVKNDSYKRNAINADLNRAAQIISIFAEKLPTTKQTF